VAETKEAIFMLEPKASNQMDDPVVHAKRESVLQWCENASNHAMTHGGKPWRYLLISHDAIAENHTLAGLAMRFGDAVWRCGLANERSRTG
jgi:type III restriction enzyme